MSGVRIGGVVYKYSLLYRELVSCRELVLVPCWERVPNLEIKFVLFTFIFFCKSQAKKLFITHI